MKIRESLGSRAFDIVNAGLLIALAVITLYPLYHVGVVSISHGSAVARGEVSILPIRLTLVSYKAILTDDLFLSGFRNSVLYTVVGTSVNLLMSVLCAYPLSVATFSGKKPFTLMIVVTMFFSGGMIPNYLLIKSLGLLDSMWALILPGAISAWNMIIIRTYFQGLPDSLRESSYIDGANDIIILFRIFLPLSMPVIATMALRYAVGHWNSFFSALIYLKDAKRYPLQLILRNMLVEDQIGGQRQLMVEEAGGIVEQTVKYAAIMVSTIPILCVYPFLQKYFVKGALIGSIKG